MAIGQNVKLQIGKLTKFHGNKLLSRHNSKLTKWQIDKMTSWRNDLALSLGISLLQKIIIILDVLDQVPVAEIQTLDGPSKTFNPYPILGAPSDNTWPRGLPLHEILSPDNWQATLQPSQPTSIKAFGVLQSLADIQPGTNVIKKFLRNLQITVIS